MVITYSADSCNAQHTFTEAQTTLDRKSYLYYAACHGKGIQDAAHARIKTRVGDVTPLGDELRCTDAASLVSLMHEAQLRQVSRQSKAHELDNELDC